MDPKLKDLSKSGIENFVDLELADLAAGQIISTFVDSLKDRIEKVKQTDQVYDKIYKEEKKRGLISKAFLKDKIKLAKKLTIKTHKGSETGKFGRILGEVFADGVNLNQMMCNDGYAVQYYGQNKSLVEAQHMKNKQKLIRKGIYK